MAEHRHVKRRGLFRAVDAGSSASGARSIIQASALATAASPPSRRMSARPAMSHAVKPGAVQSGKQHAGIAVAQIGLSPRRLRQPGHDLFDHAARAVSAAREPDRVEALVVGDVEKGLRAGFVVTRQNVHATQSIADGRRSPACGPDRDAPTRAGTLAATISGTCARRARRRRSCILSRSCGQPGRVVPHRPMLVDFADVPTWRLLFLRHRRQRHAPLALIIQARGGASRAPIARSTRDATPNNSISCARAAFRCIRRTAAASVATRQILVASAAVEETVPDVQAARRVGAVVVTRARTSRPTVQRGRPQHRRRRHQRQVHHHRHDRLDSASRRDASPTIMNGADMKNFVDAGAPFASALVGDGDIFVSEVDESDGSIALYPAAHRGREQYLARPQVDRRAAHAFSGISSPRRRSPCSISTTRKRRRLPQSLTAGTRRDLQSACGASRSRGISADARAGGNLVQGEGARDRRDASR